jgi:hypothetical protein
LFILNSSKCGIRIAYYVYASDVRVPGFELEHERTDLGKRELEPDEAHPTEVVAQMPNGGRAFQGGQ